MLIGTDPDIMPVGVAPTRSDAHHFLYGVSPAMRSLDRVIGDIASTDIPILLGGESGTGKEVVALEFHRRSHRRNEAFLKCSCGSVTADSLVTHLSFRSEGRNEPQGRGTIFLDEINQLDSPSQDSLLKLLSAGDQILPQPSAGLRVISSTTRNLEEEMRCGRFHQELYYRINGVYLRLPSLRDRKEDIPLLLGLFLKKYASLFGLAEPQLGQATVDELLQHPWPGNVRELETFARKIVALQDEHLALRDLASGLTLLSAGFPSHAASLAAPLVPAARGKMRSLKEASREASRRVERELILKVLERTRWNRKRTARELQISYKALLYKLKQLGLDGADNSEATIGESRRTI